MARFQLVDPQQDNHDSAELLQSVQKQLGGVPNFMRALANSPATLAGFLDFHTQLGRGKLSLKTRERIALAMAEANTCQYCVSAHSTLGGKAGLSEDEILAARQGGSADAKADAAVQFARQVLDSRGEVTAAELQAVRDAGYGDDEIVEIIAHVALNTWTNFLGKAGQIDIDFPEVALLGETAGAV